MREPQVLGPRRVGMGRYAPWLSTLRRSDNHSTPLLLLWVLEGGIAMLCRRTYLKEGLGISSIAARSSTPAEDLLTGGLSLRWKTEGNG